MSYLGEHGDPITVRRSLQEWEAAGDMLDVCWAFPADLNCAQKLGLKQCFRDGVFAPGKREPPRRQDQPRNRHKVANSVDGECSIARLSLPLKRDPAGEASGYPLLGNFHRRQRSRNRVGRLILEGCHDSNGLP